MFSPGDLVSVTDEDLYGVVTRVEGRQVFIETEDGFEFPYREDQLVERRRLESYDLSKHVELEMIRIKSDVEQEHRKKKVPSLTKTGKWEVDLHIEELVDSVRGMTNADILILQLSHFKSCMYQARREGCNALVVIHGVGEGVLKSEVLRVLHRTDNIEFFDADFRQYGQGATEIRFFGR